MSPERKEKKKEKKAKTRMLSSGNENERGET
jgi:hypothetical protein